MIESMLFLGVSLIAASFIFDLTQGVQRQPIRIDKDSDIERPQK